MAITAIQFTQFLDDLLDDAQPFTGTNDMGSFGPVPCLYNDIIATIESHAHDEDESFCVQVGGERFRVSVTKE